MKNCLLSVLSAKKVLFLVWIVCIRLCVGLITSDCYQYTDKISCLNAQTKYDCNCEWRSDVNICVIKWTQPYHACFAIDSSETQSDDDFEFIKQILSGAVKSFDSQSKIGIVTFGSGAHLEPYPNGVTFDSPQNAFNTLQNLQSWTQLDLGDGAFTLDGIRMCLDALDTMRSIDGSLINQVLITTSDGPATGPRHCGSNYDQVCWPCGTDHFSFPGEVDQSTRILNNNIHTVNLIINGNAGGIDCLININEITNIQVDVYTRVNMNVNELISSLVDNIYLSNPNAYGYSTCAPTQSPLTQLPSHSPLTHSPLTHAPSKSPLTHSPTKKPTKDCFCYSRDKSSSRNRIYCREIDNKNSCRSKSKSHTCAWRCAE